MRERAVTTSVIWIALAASINQILNSINSFTSSGMQIGLLILMGVLALSAVGATVAIWQGAPTSERQNSAASAEKAKHDNRDARIRRLLDTMDDEELDLLEGGRPGDDGERLSLEALMRKRDSR